MPQSKSLNRSPIESADALEGDRSNEALEADALEAVALEADALEADALEADAVEADALEATTKQTAVAEALSMSPVSTYSAPRNGEEDSGSPYEETREHP